MSKASNFLNETDNSSFDQLIKFLDSVAASIPEAKKELQTGKVGYRTNSLVGKLVRSADEPWYRKLFK